MAQRKRSDVLQGLRSALAGQEGEQLRRELLVLLSSVPAPTPVSSGPTRTTRRRARPPDRLSPDPSGSRRRRRSPSREPGQSAQGAARGRGGSGSSGQVRRQVGSKAAGPGALVKAVAGSREGLRSGGRSRTACAPHEGQVVAARLEDPVPGSSSPVEFGGASRSDDGGSGAGVARGTGAAAAPGARMEHRRVAPPLVLPRVGGDDPPRRGRGMEAVDRDRGGGGPLDRRGGMGCESAGGRSPRGTSRGRVVPLERRGGPRSRSGSRTRSRSRSRRGWSRGDSVHRDGHRRDRCGGRSPTPVRASSSRSFSHSRSVGRQDTTGHSGMASREARCRSRDRHRSRSPESSESVRQSGLQDGPSRRPGVGAVSAAGSGSGRGRISLPSGSVEDRDNRLRRLVRSSVAASTWAAYGKVWKEWEQLVDWAEGWSSSDGRRELMLWWVYWMAETGRSAAQIDKGRAALAFWFKLKGWVDLTKDFVVRQVVRGLKKGNIRCDTRRPVSVPMLTDLLRVLEGICFSQYEVHLFRLAFLLAFFGAFRIGELVSPSKRVLGGLQKADVELGVDWVGIWLRRKKTDQLGKGRRVVLYALEGASLCPFASLQWWLEVSPSREGPLLIHMDGTPLTRFQFVKVFRWGLAQIGKAPMEYGSHSFRIGAATEAARLGLGEAVVRRIGRWESKRFQSYVRPELI
ncbi:uncharacterized protein LOC108719089 [Xenopus laevis]|uniref:Uncharacterized protein LOC108719089 n=1 Tax=Xenopus laevis TaxID=8355 RepID=A0A8J0VJK6_XENLA|nr:uncharacterized protein LOC108719089 [Xenopus laevis]